MKRLISISALALLLGLNAANGMDTNQVTMQSVRNEDSPVKQQNIEDLGPTLSIIKMFLKENFTGDPKKDIPAFWGSKEFTTQEGMEGDQQIEYSEQLELNIQNLIKREQDELKKGNVVLYHGLSGNYLYAYKYFADFFSRLTGISQGDFLLRGNLLYAHNPKTNEFFKNLPEVRDVYGVGDEVHDYGQDINTAILHCNIALSVGPATSNSTASSLGFFCNSFSVKDNISIKDLIVETLLYQGMPIDDAKKCGSEAEDLFKRYYLKEHEKNGGLLSISVPKEKIDDVACHVRAGGKLYNPDLGEFCDIFSNIIGCDEVNRRYLNLLFKDHSESAITESNQYYFLTSTLTEEKKQELNKEIKTYVSLLQYYPIEKRASISYLLEKLKNPENKRLSKQGVCDLTCEIALYLDPLTHFDIQGIFQYPLSKDYQESFEVEYKKMLDKHMERLKENRYKPVEGSFLTKNSEVYTVKNDSYSLDLIQFFMVHGQRDKMEHLLAQYPNFYNDERALNCVISGVINGARENFLYDNLISDNSIFNYIPEKELEVIMNFLNYIINSTACEKLAQLTEIKNLSTNRLAIFFQQFNFSKQVMEVSISRQFSFPKELKEVLKSRQYSSETMEKMLFYKNLLLSFRRKSALEIFFRLKIFIDNEFSFNPNTPLGKEYLNKLLQLCKEDNQMISILAYIIKYYKLDFNEYKDLFTLLTQYRSTHQSISLYAINADFSCDITPTGYKLKIEQQTYDIPFADVEGFEMVNLPLLGIKRPYDTKLLESLESFLSKKFNMTYSSDLITTYFDYKQTSDNHLASSYVPESHTWLAKFREAKTLEEAKNLIFELDNLDIAFFNLGLIKGYTDEEKNTWFQSIIKEYQQSLEELRRVLKEDLPLHETDLTRQEDAKRALKEAPLALVIDTESEWSLEYFAKPKNIENTLLRIVKFCTFKDVENGRMACKWFALNADVVEKALQLNPDLIKDHEFIMEILYGDLFPQSLLNDQEKLETIAKSPYKDEFFNQLIIKKSKKSLAIAKVMLKDPEIKNRLNILQKYHLLSSNVVKELIEE